MGLGDDHYAADPERVELMEGDIYVRRLRPLRRLDEGRFHGLEVVDGVRIAIEQLEKQVSSQCVQSYDPPFPDPAIYRTSPATDALVAVSTKEFFLPQLKCMVRFLPLQEKNVACGKFLTSEAARGAPPEACRARFHEGAPTVPRGARGRRARLAAPERGRARSRATRAAGTSARRAATAVSSPTSL